MDNSATISSQLSIVNCQLGVLKSYFPTLTDAQKQQIDALFDLYSDWNSKINVISRKDIENLYLLISDFNKQMSEIIDQISNLA